jgi:amino acid adenylation domain-containing protein
MEFPQDRSLEKRWTEAGATGARRCVEGRFEADVPDPSVQTQRLAVACLLVFSRMSQQAALCMRVRAQSGNGGGGWRHASVAFDERRSLAETASALQWSDGPVPDRAEIEAILCVGDADDEKERPLVVAVLPERGSSRVRLQVRFDARRISQPSAQDFLEKIMVVCQALARDPGQQVGRLELLTRTARQWIPDLSRALAAGPQPLVPHVFRDVARRLWSEPAIAGRGGTYTYGALWMEAVSLARQLRRQGLTPGDVVAVSGVSSFGTIAAMLATLLAGGVIVTLDQSLPPERLARIAAICRPRLTIRVSSPRDAPARAPSDGEVVITDWPAQGQASAEPGWQDFEIGEISDRAPAYVFFTSGSTGEPKGVLGTHLGLAHFLDWQRSNFPIGPGDRNAQLTALSFDVVLRDIFFPLTSGSCLCIPERDSLLDARRILAWMSSSGITVMHSVPSLMKAWLQAEHGARPFRSIRYIFFAGEPLTDTLLASFRAAASPAARIVNLYGPTETTLAKLCNPIERVEPGVQPIGHPQPGVDAFVMRDRSARCGLWETGEIVIRTPYRSKGYLGRDDLTRQVFIPNPWRDDPEDLLYCTGDLGRLRADGKLEIFGRVDSQIKIRGVRIEPNEIEAELTKIDFIQEAAISARLNRQDEKFLVAFVVLRDRSDAEARKDGGQAGLSQRIRSRLRGTLHDAMVPKRYVFVEELPYLPTGKLDRKAIAALEIGAAVDEGADDRRLQDLSAAHRAIVRKIEAVLGQPIKDIGQSFVDLGGDSLSFIQVTLVLERSLGPLPRGWEKLPLETLFSPTRPASRVGHWTGIEVPLLFRAVGILLVVLSHTSVVDLLGTSVLFVISGISFGKFQRPAIIQTGSLQGVLRFILRYGVPAGLWQLMRSLTFHRFWLPDLVLLGTMLQKPGEGHWTLWYLDMLTANVLLLSAIALLNRRWRRAQGANQSDGHRFGFDCGVVLAGMGLAVVQAWTGWWNGKLGVTSVGPFLWFWLVAYGVVISQAAGFRQRALLTALLALPWASTALRVPVLGTTFGFLDLVFYGSMVCVLWLDTIPIPRLLKGILVEVASASLFIYILNVFIISQLLPRFGVPPGWPLQTLAAVGAGVLANRSWNWLLSVLNVWATRPQTGPTGLPPASSGQAAA